MKTQKNRIYLMNCGLNHINRRIISTCQTFMAELMRGKASESQKLLTLIIISGNSSKLLKKYF